VVCVQSKGHRKGSRLVACTANENRVVILDLDTSDQEMVEVKYPWKCAASQQYIAVTTHADGLHLFTLGGNIVQVIPDSKNAYCAAFQRHNPTLLAIGFRDGCARIWDVRAQAVMSSFKEHNYYITSIRFALDGRLFISSKDTTASIVTFDSKYLIQSHIKLNGHTNWVNDILPLISNQCVTCSNDKTIKVWDCTTGACLHTLKEHPGDVTSLAMSTKAGIFASGSLDRSVIIWSSETFERLHRIELTDGVQSFEVGDSGTLYVGVYSHGAISCNVITGEVGPVVIPSRGSVEGLAIGMVCDSA
jgi:WD40 repeat protein